MITTLLQQKKSTKILITLLSMVLLVGVIGSIQAFRTTSYSVDKTNYRFVSDIKAVYTNEESKDIEISFIDTTTGEKPAGVSVTMQVDNGPVQTVLSAASRTSSRFVNMGNLSEGTHQVTFTLPEACGNFFDFSNFDQQTKFDNQFDCQFVRQFTVGAGITSGTCTDTSAVNTGGSLPCTYLPGVTNCPDPMANNTGSPLPCTYGVVDVDGCTNSLATNYNPNATNNDGSCVFPPNILNGCTDPTARNYIPTAQNDDGTCEYHVYGCTDGRALNFDSTATASDSSCEYDGAVTASDFECSINNRLWVACEGRTFTLRAPNVPIYVRTEPQSAGTWSDWCTGDLNNGVQAGFTELVSDGQNARVDFTFANEGTLFDMTLCLDPDSATKAQTFQRIKLKLLDTKFIEN